MKRISWYMRFSQTISSASGRPTAFNLAVVLIAAWLITGPVFGFSDTWQLIMNTITSIITFLMVFIIQNTQNRETHAIQVKLDELIRTTAGAHNALMDLEELEEGQLEMLRQRYEIMAREARKEKRQGKTDTDIKEV